MDGSSELSVANTRLAMRKLYAWIWIKMWSKLDTLDFASEAHGQRPLSTFNHAWPARCLPMPPLLVFSVCYYTHLH
jgi:hypothetical protein